MTITLYTFSGSPFGWRPQLALEHKGVAYEVHHVQAGKGEHRSEDYLRKNPRGKVPALQHGDVALYESAVIVEYLEERFPEQPSLFPQDVVERTRVRRLVAEIDQYWWPAAWQIAQNVYFKSDPKTWDAEAIEGGRKTLVEELAFFEGQVRGEGLAGDALTAADFALYPMLAHLARYERRKPELGLTEHVGPGLRRLMKKVETQSYFDRTYPPHWRS